MIGIKGDVGQQGLPGILNIKNYLKNLLENIPNILTLF